MEQTYVARRELKVGEGFIQAGELYPPSQVTQPLLANGWVVEGTGPLPRDQRCHGLFPAGTRGAARTKVSRKAPPPTEPPATLADLPPRQRGVPEPEEAVRIGRGTRRPTASARTR